MRCSSWVYMVSNTIDAAYDDMFSRLFFLNGEFCYLYSGDQIP
jgi:hypothetical protein